MVTSPATSSTSTAIAARCAPWPVTWAFLYRYPALWRNRARQRARHGKVLLPRGRYVERLARRDRRRVIERRFSPVKIMSVDNLPFRARLNAQSGRLSTLNLHAGENPRSFYADGAARVSAPPERLQLLEHGRAAGEHIAVRGIKVAGVPGSATSPGRSVQSSRREILPSGSQPKMRRRPRAFSASI